MLEGYLAPSLGIGYVGEGEDASSKGQDADRPIS